VREGIVYLQVTRGVARRDHPFPTTPVAPALVVTARSSDRAALEKRAGEGIAVVSVPDNRWGRVDIKSVGLLPNVLAKQHAIESGAREAWFVDSAGFVTEGGSTNAWIVTKNGRLVTRQTDEHILAGVTRRAVLDMIRSRNLTLEERPFTLAEALDAAEAFVSSAGNLVMPVVRLDGRPIGDGTPGPVALALRAGLHEVTEMSLPVFPDRA
jgi:D-alanine transaminase